MNPKDRYGPEFPKAMRCLAARWEPEGLPVSLSPLSSTPGHTGGTGMTALEPRLWLEHDNVPHQRHPTVSRFVKVSSTMFCFVSFKLNDDFEYARIHNFGPILD